MSRTFLLQDWVTIRATNASTTAFTQDEERWLDLAGYSDAACWIDVAEVTPPASGTAVTIGLETAAVCDDLYFTPIAGVAYGTAAPFNLASTTPTVVRSTRAVSASALMRYLRWKITPNGSGLWDLTFRIRAVATRSSAFVPTDLSGCLLWLRGDLGITFNGSNVSGWADQSGNGNDATQTTALNRPGFSNTAVNGLPAISGNGSSQFMSTPAISVGTTMTWFVVLQSAVGTQSGYVRILEQQYNTSYYLGVDTTGTHYKLIVNNATPPYGIAQGGTVTAGSNVIVSATYASPTGRIFVNGTQVASDSFTAPASASQAMFIMNAYNGAAEYWNGYVAEVIAYGRALSATELTRVHRYLGGRYNISVP